MAMFLAKRIIKGQTTFAKVPPTLKEPVADILTKEGYSNLITDAEIPSSPDSEEDSGNELA